eukprot:TRINITY_DN31911_c0_g1_i1.p1 TRINITY_DN31911_c0_g1~~TRINITY_DN31911_c0_g1_i1.p1  ORF type:complete len:140 (+),score=63.08 TRINITY_DN31911_c0_g1_i1:69-488(+)
MPERERKKPDHFAPEEPKESPKRKKSPKAKESPAKKSKKAEAKSPKAAKAKGEKTKKAKKEKDPNAPKRPLSAYFLFMGDNRAAVKKANPDASTGELGKLLGEAWKAVKPAEKKKYEDLAAKAKVDYEKAKKKYEASKE